MPREPIHDTRLTIQMAGDTVAELDDVARRAGMTRSEAIREAARDWIEKRRHLVPA